MYGYIFEVTNKKTGETYVGKKYSVAFDKNYFGEEVNESLAVAIEKYGRPAFESRMLMPYESKEAVDGAFEAVKPAVPKRTVKKKEPVVTSEAPAEEPVEEVKAPRKRSTKKKVEEK